MQITHFQPARDLNRLEDYLRARYLETHNTVSWLPDSSRRAVLASGIKHSDKPSLLPTSAVQSFSSYLIDENPSFAFVVKRGIFM